MKNEATDLVENKRDDKKTNQKRTKKLGPSGLPVA